MPVRRGVVMMRMRYGIEEPREWVCFRRGANHKQPNCDPRCN